MTANLTAEETAEQEAVRFAELLDDCGRWFGRTEPKPPPPNRESDQGTRVSDE